MAKAKGVAGGPIRHFDTFTDYLASLASTPRWDSARSQSETCGARFSGTDSYSDAIGLAEHGWPDGVERIERLSATLTDKVAATIKRQTVVYDVVGDTFDMGRVVTGEPESAMHFTESEAEVIGRRVLRIGVNLTVSHVVDTEAIMRRGAAIASLVDCLERSGIRCEVTLVDVLQATLGATQDAATVHIRVKASSDALQLDKLAFTLVHPSMLRRLSFRYRESQAIPQVLSDRMTHGGYGTSLTNADESHFDIFIGTQRYDDAGWIHADRWVREQLLAQGVEMEGGE